MRIGLVVLVLGLGAAGLLVRYILRSDDLPLHVEASSPPAKEKPAQVDPPVEAPDPETIPVPVRQSRREPPRLRGRIRIVPKGDAVLEGRTWKLEATLEPDGQMGSSGSIAEVGSGRAIVTSSLRDGRVDMEVPAEGSFMLALSSPDAINTAMCRAFTSKEFEWRVEVTSSILLALQGEEQQRVTNVQVEGRPFSKMPNRSEYEYRQPTTLVFLPVELHVGVQRSDEPIRMVISSEVCMAMLPDEIARLRVVSSKSGDPIAGASVTSSWHDAEGLWWASREAKSASDGSCNIPVETGSGSLEILAEGFLGARGDSSSFVPTDQPHAASQMKVELVPLWYCDGRVVDLDEKPLVGARFLLFASSGPVVHCSGLTTATGHFTSIREEGSGGDLRSGFWLTASVPRQSIPMFKHLGTTEGLKKSGIGTIRLRSLRPDPLRVWIRHEKKPVAGLRVRVRPSMPQSYGDTFTYWSHESDAQGTVVLDLFRECAWEIRADHPELGGGAMVLQTGDTASGAVLELKQGPPR